MISQYSNLPPFPTNFNKIVIISFPLSRGALKDDHMSGKGDAVMQIFNISLDKLFTKQSRCRSFYTPWSSCDVTVIILAYFYLQYHNLWLQYCTKLNLIFPRRGLRQKSIRSLQIASCSSDTINVIRSRKSPFVGQIDSGKHICRVWE